ncbi:MAG: SDR family oxidoreductase, partial [Actinobacteria bacterium]|nr:SDR family oxidoreductase [Actinomycetota bacterium]
VQNLRAVVNLVGGFSMGTKVEGVELADFEGMLRLNLVPAFNLARAAMPRLAAAEGGTFVCVSARAALEPFPGAAGYITAKAGVHALVRALDSEYRDAGVRCNAVLPSVIDTPANRESMPEADWSKWVPPEEIARVIRFLCSQDSAPTSGAGIPVYGRA